MQAVVRKGLPSVLVENRSPPPRPVSGVFMCLQSASSVLRPFWDLVGKSRVGSDSIAFGLGLSACLLVPKMDPCRTRKIKIKGWDGGHIKSKCAGYDTAVMCVCVCVYVRASLPLPSSDSVIHLALSVRVRCASAPGGNAAPLVFTVRTSILGWGADYPELFRHVPSSCLSESEPCSLPYP